MEELKFDEEVLEGIGCFIIIQISILYIQISYLILLNLSLHHLFGGLARFIGKTRGALGLNEGLSGSETSRPPTSEGVGTRFSLYS